MTFPTLVWSLALRTQLTRFLFLAIIGIAAPLAAQDTNAPQPATGHITGTVIDANGDTISGATVVLQGPALKDPLKLVVDSALGSHPLPRFLSRVLVSENASALFWAVALLLATAVLDPRGRESAVLRP